MKEVHIASIQNRITGNKCPSCGKPADGGTSIDDEETAPNPKPGDIAVCLYCGALNEYGANLMLRQIDRTERRRLLQRDPRLREILELASSIAQQKRRQWQ